MLLSDTFTGIDTLLFLDKSTRPIYWLLRDRWQHRSLGQMPYKILFANIGMSTVLDIKFSNIRCDKFDLDILRRQVTEDGGICSGDIHREIKDQLVQDTKAVHNDLKKSFGRYDFTGKNVMIFDEFYSSGTTSLISLVMMSHVFPNTKWRFMAIFGPNSPWHPLDIEECVLYWHHTHEGYMGVLDNPDQSSFHCVAITECNLGAIQDFLRHSKTEKAGQIRQYLKENETNLIWGLNLIREWILERQTNLDQQIVDSINEWLNDAKSVEYLLSQVNTLNIVDLIALSQHVESLMLFSDIRLSITVEEKNWLGEDGKVHLSIFRAWRALLGICMNVQELIDNVCKFSEKQELTDRHLTLRRDLRQLARM